MTAPSKKIIYLAAGAFLIVILIFVFKNYDFSKSLSNNQSLSYNASNPDQGVDSGIDTDADGLTDWQEINIWRTDPSNADTDHDGTPDGTEVAEGRDPSKQAPNDDLQRGDPRTSAAIRAQISNDSSSNSNLTQNLSKSFFTNYLSSQDSSGGLDANGQANVIQNSLGSLSVPPLAAKYTLGSLKIIDPTPAEIRAFGNSIATIEKTNLAAVIGQKNNPEAFGALITAYRDNAGDLANISVPRDIATVYLQIINADNQLAISLSDIENYNVDPVKALVAIKTYQALEAAEPALYQNIAAYFKNNDIIFTNNESGYVWNNY